MGRETDLRPQQNLSTRPEIEGSSQYHWIPELEGTPILPGEKPAPRSGSDAFGEPREELAQTVELLRPSLFLLGLPENLFIWAAAYTASPSQSGQPFPGRGQLTHPAGKTSACPSRLTSDLPPGYPAPDTPS